MTLSRLTGRLQSRHRGLTPAADDDRVRRAALLGAIAAILALGWTGTGTAAANAIDRGVVQSAGPQRIVLRELDGSTVAIPVDPATRVRLNGRPAAIGDVLPGFVAIVQHNGSRPARVIRAFGAVQRLVDQGVVASVSGRTVVVRTGSGRLLTVHVTARTVIRLRGVPAGLAAVQRGRSVEVVHTQSGEALRLVLRRTA